MPVMVQVSGACSTVPSDFIQQHAFEDKSMNFKAATGGLSPKCRALLSSCSGLSPWPLHRLFPLLGMLSRPLSPVHAHASVPAQASLPWEVCVVPSPQAGGP